MLYNIYYIYNTTPLAACLRKPYCSYAQNLKAHRDFITMQKLHDKHNMYCRSLTRQNGLGKKRGRGGGSEGGRTGMALGCPSMWLTSQKLVPQN